MFINRVGFSHSSFDNRLNLAILQQSSQLFSTFHRSGIAQHMPIVISNAITKLQHSAWIQSFWPAEQAFPTGAFPAIAAIRQLERFYRSVLPTSDYSLQEAPSCPFPNSQGATQASLRDGAFTIENKTGI